MSHCTAETREFPDAVTGDPYGFEVWCSVHGLVFSYNVVAVRALGAKELQRRIDRAWLLHAATEQN